MAVADYIGRVATLAPSLTSVTTKITTTNAPSASAIPIERARRARCCSSVSLMPVSGFCSLIPHSSSCREMAQQASRHPIDQEHRKQHKQVEDREGEQLFARGVALPFGAHPQRQRDHHG